MDGAAQKEKAGMRSRWLFIGVHLGSWKTRTTDGKFYNYRELAPMLADYVKKWAIRMWS